MEKGKLVLEDRLYTETDEWVKKVGEKRFQMGITDYAQHHLKDIYIIDLPKIGVYVKQSQAWGTIESEKGANELVSPINGKVIAINQDNFGDISGTEEPSPTTVRYGGDLYNINKKPYETWLIEIEADDKSQLEKLLTVEDYKKKINA